MFLLLHLGLFTVERSIINESHNGDILRLVADDLVHRVMPKVSMHDCDHCAVMYLGSQWHGRFPHGCKRWAKALAAQICLAYFFRAEYSIQFN